MMGKTSISAARRVWRWYWRSDAALLLDAAVILAAALLLRALGVM